MSQPEPAVASILVVDDDPLVTRTLASLLTLERPWRVVTFEDPAAAAASLDEHDYHVALVDFLMPGLDGLALLERVRERRPLATRVLLTGYADKRSAIDAINRVGLYQYLEKPWDNDALLLVLQNAVERSELLREVEARMGELGERDRALRALRERLMKALL